LCTKSSTQAGTCDTMQQALSLFSSTCSRLVIPHIGRQGSACSCGRSPAGFSLSKAQGRNVTGGSSFHGCGREPKMATHRTAHTLPLRLVPRSLLEGLPPSNVHRPTHGRGTPLTVPGCALRSHRRVPSL